MAARTPVLSPPAVVGIVLAAGGSTRMGRPKALLPWRGDRPLVEAWLARLAPRCRSLYVVVGGHAEAVAAALPAAVGTADVRAVHNPDWRDTGPRESLLLALARAHRDHPLPELRAFVTPVDVPPPPSPVLDALLAAGGAAVPRHDGRDGHPVLAPVAVLQAALAAATLRDALVDAQRVDVDAPEILANLNHPDEWTRWRERAC